METQEVTAPSATKSATQPPPAASPESNGSSNTRSNAATLGLGEGVDFAQLKQVPMTVQVEIGRTAMTLGEVLDELEVGASIRLDRHAGDPVEVYVNGALFARAEVVLVQDQIGARIIELINPDKAARPAGLR